MHSWLSGSICFLFFQGWNVMKTMLLSLSVLLLGVAACSKSAVEMKPGLWETRIVKMEQDGKDVTDMMNAAMASNPKAARMCISKEMASKIATNPPAAGGASQLSKAGCEQPKINRSGNSITAEITCNNFSSKSETVVASDQITSKTELVMTMGGAKHTSSSETQMKFISSDCGGN
jgi:hypothetical protein